MIKKNKEMNKKRKVFFISVSVALFIAFFVIRINNSLYHKRFLNIDLGTKITFVKKMWGNPSYEFVCKNCDNNIVLKYKKDITGWNTYIYVFDKKDSLLIKKTIDD